MLTGFVLYLGEVEMMIIEKLECCIWSLIWTQFSGGDWKKAIARRGECSRRYSQYHWIVDNIHNILKYHRIVHDIHKILSKDLPPGGCRGWWWFKRRRGGGGDILLAARSTTCPHTSSHIIVNIMMGSGDFAFWIFLFGQSQSLQQNLRLFVLLCIRRGVEGVSREVQALMPSMGREASLSLGRDAAGLSMGREVGSLSRNPTRLPDCNGRPAYAR